MVFHHWESNFTPKENGFTLFSQPNNVKLKKEENSFPRKRFTPYQTKPTWRKNFVFLEYVMSVVQLFFCIIVDD